VSIRVQISETDNEIHTRTSFGLLHTRQKAVTNSDPNCERTRTRKVWRRRTHIRVLREND
jgi:hypothetical protein